MLYSMLVIDEEGEYSHEPAQIEMHRDMHGISIIDPRTGANILVELTTEGMRCIIHPRADSDASCGVTMNPHQIVIEDSRAGIRPAFDTIVLDIEES